MIKIPANAAKWKNLGYKQERYKKMFLVMGTIFLGVTLDHCLDFAKKMREQKIEELKAEVASVAYSEKEKEEMLKVFGLSDKSN
jgi:hypothetical protein